MGLDAAEFRDAWNRVIAEEDVPALELPPLVDYAPSEGVGILVARDIVWIVFDSGNLDFLMLLWLNEPDGSIRQIDVDWTPGGESNAAEHRMMVYEAMIRASMVPPAGKEYAAEVLEALGLVGGRIPSSRTQVTIGDRKYTVGFANNGEIVYLSVNTSSDWKNG